MGFIYAINFTLITFYIGKNPNNYLHFLFNHQLRIYFGVGNDF